MLHFCFLLQTPRLCFQITQILFNSVFIKNILRFQLINKLSNLHTHSFFISLCLYFLQSLALCCVLTIRIVCAWSQDGAVHTWSGIWGYSEKAGDQAEGAVSEMYWSGDSGADQYSQTVYTEGTARLISLTNSPPRSCVCVECLQSKNTQTILQYRTELRDIWLLIPSIQQHIEEKKRSLHIYGSAVTFASVQDAGRISEKYSWDTKTPYDRKHVMGGQPKRNQIWFLNTFYRKCITNVLLLKSND